MKKIIITILVLMLVAVLVGCNKSVNQTDDNNEKVENSNVEENMDNQQKEENSLETEKTGISLF